MVFTLSQKTLIAGVVDPVVVMLMRFSLMTRPDGAPASLL
jgi:hypothetical protein